MGAMTTTSWLNIVTCWVISCLFNGIEAAALALDPVRLRHHAKLNNRAAMRLSRLLEQPERLLVSRQVTKALGQIAHVISGFILLLATAHGPPSTDALSDAGASGQAAALGRLPREQQDQEPTECKEAHVSERARLGHAPVTGAQ